MHKLFIGICLLFSGVLSFSQDVKELIQRNLNARGGVERLLNLRTISVSGRIISEGSVFFMQFYRKMPSKLRLQVEINKQKGVTVFNGDKAWIIDPSRNIETPALIDQEEAEILKPMILYDFVFYDDVLLNYHRKENDIISAELQPSPDNNHSLIRIVLTDSTHIFYYFDKLTFLDRRHDVVFKRMNSQIILNLKDFRNVKGINVPFLIESKLGNKVYTRIVVDEVTIDNDVDDSLFEMPE